MKNFLIIAVFILSLGLCISEASATDNDAIVNSVRQELRQDTISRGYNVLRKVGEPLPPFALYDQNGLFLQNKDFNRKYVIVSFIFTRCGNPKACPLTMKKMVDVQKKCQEAKIDGLEHVIISFDPKFDTPEVLKKFGEAYGVNEKNFCLLTGDSQIIEDLMKQFGVYIVNGDGTMSHAIVVIIVGPDGKIDYKQVGQSWTIDEIVNRLPAS